MTNHKAAAVSRSRIRAAGGIWVCAAQFFFAQVFAQLAWKTPFSLATNYISDLGNTRCAPYPLGTGSYVCSPLHAVMNVSFSLQGVIILAGAVLAWPLLQRKPVRPIMFILLALTGLGMIGVGLFPEDVNHSGHVISAGIQFITGNLAMIVFGLAGDTINLRRPLFVASTALGVAGLAATVLFVTGNGLGLGVGGMERVAAYTIPVWLIAAGILLITKLSESPAPLN